MSSFFSNPASQRKRKRPDAPSTASKRRTVTTAPPTPKKTPARKVRDESISASDSDDSGKGKKKTRDEYESEDDSSSGGEDETADERRLRLAQRYLDNIKEEVAEDPNAFDAADVDRDLIAERLKEDVAGTKGRLHRKIAEELDFSHAAHTYFSGDQNGVTAIACIPPFVFTVSTDRSICKWEIPSPTTALPTATNIAVRRKPKLVKRFRPPQHPGKKFQGHVGPILCITASSSGKYLATGGADNRLIIWDPETLTPLKFFTHHRDDVVSVSFRQGTHTLYSGSKDRTCKVWSMDERAYVQTLFGHQDFVVDIGGMRGEKFVSVGGRDRTARLFKVIEEQQLVFRGGGGGGSSRKGRDVESTPVMKFEEGNIDRVAIIDEETFVTGSDNGSISLWSVLRKKPVYTISAAHGWDAKLGMDEAYAEDAPGDKERPGREKPRWITALRTVPLTDLILTGSWDGCVRVWRITMDRRRLEAVGVIGPSHTGLAPHVNGDLDTLLGEINGTVNGTTTNGHVNGDIAKEPESKPKPIPGFINDLSIFERGTNGKDGLCIVAVVSKTHRLGGWQLPKSPPGATKAKNGAVVFEVCWKDLGMAEDGTVRVDGVNGVNGDVEVVK